MTKTPPHYLLWKNHLVLSTQMHKREEAEKGVVIGIEIAIGKGLVLGIPQGIDKLLGMAIGVEQRGGGYGSYKTDAMAQGFLGTTGTQNLIISRKSSVDAVLINKIVNSLGVEEVLNLLAILLLPLTVDTAPGVVEGNVHGHTP